MELKQRPSGLVVPVIKPSPRPRQFGPLELSDAEDREKARKILYDLWDVMELSQSPGLVIGNRAQHEIYWQAYQFIGNLLLGKDCPEKEVWT